MEIVLASAVLDQLRQTISWTISGAAAREFELTRGLLEEIEKLECTVMEIHSVLRDAEQREASDPAVRSRLLELKQVCLDADDILDEHAIDVALLSRSSEGRKKVCGMMFRCFAWMNRTPSVTATAHQIRTINQRLEELQHSENGFRFLFSPTGNIPLQDARPEQRPETSSLLVDDDWVIGRDSEKERIIELKGSMILVTTRNSDAMKGRGRMDPIVLQGLPDAHIWSLFLRYAFFGDRNADGTIDAKYPSFKGMREEIVRRLVGSPLAAKTLGSLLHRMRPNAEHWREILNNEIWETPDVNSIWSTLGLSYRHLSWNLKQCFAYCSLFPRDYEFGKEELIQLWGAQSFIRTQEGVLMEATGDQSCDDLLQMGFFKPSPFRDNCYVIHDLIHDLAESVSKDDCFMVGDQIPMRSVPETVRHISICAKEYDQTNLKELCRHEKLRTLLFLGSWQFDASTPRVLDVLCLKLKRLRVLQLRGCGIRVLPSSAGDLKHLRYIDLSKNPLEILPESLGNLYKLQVLNLKGTHGSLSKLPSRMSELINLRHLQADSALVASIDGLSKLTNLQELYITGRKVSEVAGMSMLRVLDVSHLEQVRSKDEAIQASLKSKKHLQVLRLGWGTNGRDARSINRQMEEVLEALQPSHTITELSLRGYEGTKSPTWLQDMSVFSCLRDLAIAGGPILEKPISFPRTLKRLDLDGGQPGVLTSWGRRQDGGEGTSYSSSSSVSDSLSELRVKDQPNLTSVSELLQYSRIAYIRELHISGCKELTSLPEEGFRHLVSLKKLNICKCPKLKSPSPLPSAVATTTSLPHSLKALQIEGCGDAMDGWWWEGLEQLTSLAQLTLGGCPKTLASFFISLGRCCHLHRLGETLSQLLIRDCQVESSPSTSSSPSLAPPTPSEDTAGVFRGLTSLKQLELSRSPNLLRRWGLGGLPSSLESLTIDGDDNLTDTYLFGRLGNLTSLQSLSITGVDNLICLTSMLSSIPFPNSLKIGSIHCSGECRNFGQWGRWKWSKWGSGLDPQKLLVGSLHPLP